METIYIYFFDGNKFIYGLLELYCRGKKKQKTSHHRSPFFFHFGLDGLTLKNIIIKASLVLFFFNLKTSKTQNGYQTWQYLREREWSWSNWQIKWAHTGTWAMWHHLPFLCKLTENFFTVKNKSQRIGLISRWCFAFLITALLLCWKNSVDINVSKSLLPHSSHRRCSWQMCVMWVTVMTVKGAGPDGYSIGNCSSILVHYTVSGN